MFSPKWLRLSYILYQSQEISNSSIFHVVDSIKNQNKSILELNVLESQPNVMYFKKHVGFKSCLIIGIDMTNYI